MVPFLRSSHRNIGTEVDGGGVEVNLLLLPADAHAPASRTLS